MAIDEAHDALVTVRESCVFVSWPPRLGFSFDCSLDEWYPIHLHGVDKKDPSIVNVFENAVFDSVYLVGASIILLLGFTGNTEFHR